MVSEISSLVQKVKHKIKSAFTIYVFLKRLFNCFVTRIPLSKRTEVMRSLSNFSYADVPQQRNLLLSLHPRHEVPTCPQSGHGLGQESLPRLPHLTRPHHHQRPRSWQRRWFGSQLFPCKDPDPCKDDGAERMKPARHGVTTGIPQPATRPAPCSARGAPADESCHFCWKHPFLSQTLMLGKLLYASWLVCAGTASPVFNY